MTRPSVFGFGANSFYIGAEFLFGGCLRVQVDGARRIDIAHYDALREMHVDSRKPRVTPSAMTTS